MRFGAGMIAVAVSSLLMVGCGGGEVESEPAVTLAEVWTAEGEFQSPQSAAYDIRREVIYVCSVSGDEKSGEGFISVLSPAGEILVQRWIEGLNAPTGLAMSGDTLYVADIDRLLSISIPDEKIVSVYAAPEEAPGFNDVAADPAGELYVSGSGSSTIYKLWEGGLASWFSDPDILQANGLYVDGGSVWVAGYHLRSISLIDGTMSAPGTDETLSVLESIEGDGKGGFFVTGVGLRPIYHLSAGGEVTTLLERDVSSGDLEYIEMGRLLIVPSGGDKVVAYRVKWAE